MDAVIKGSNTDRSKFTQVSSSHFLFLGEKKRFKEFNRCSVKAGKTKHSATGTF